MILPEKEPDPETINKFKGVYRIDNPKISAHGWRAVKGLNGKKYSRFYADRKYKNREIAFQCACRFVESAGRSRKALENETPMDVKVSLQELRSINYGIFAKIKTPPFQRKLKILIKRLVEFREMVFTVSQEYDTPECRKEFHEMLMKELDIILFHHES